MCAQINFYQNLVRLYQQVVPDTILNDDEIMNWAPGTNENSKILFKKSQSFEDIQQINNYDRNNLR